MLKLSKKYWIAIICKMCFIFTTFMATIFINRGLGVRTKGEYAYIINLVEMLYVIFSLGIGQTYSTFKRSTGESTRAGFIALGLIHGAIIIICGGIYVYISNVKYGWPIIILTALAVIKIIISMIAVIEESIRRNIIQSGINVIYLIALAILYFTHKCSLTTVLICYGLNDIVRIILLMKVYGMRPSLKGLSKKTIASIYRMGIITMLVMLLITINYSVDTIMLKNISSTYYVGLYSVGVTFSNMFLLIPDAFKEVLFGDSTKKDFAKGAAIDSIKISLIASIVILIGFTILGKWAIRIFYGSDFLPSYTITLILFIGSFSMIFFKILQPIYISHGCQTRAAVFLLCSAVANIIINFICIPRYNAIGAAIASAVSYTVCGCLFLFDYLKHFEKMAHNQIK